ncbi:MULTISPECIES: hypothetical protein [unclassified Streptomyces]|uniref:hypothetical protein n=1 Tax=unclassified Streptomyces TaxID=2593676 RepID=UPI0004BE0E49|nr:MULTISPECIES: hypothetical protein [unclassified Streptomyces]
MTVDMTVQQAMARGRARDERLRAVTWAVSGLILLVLSAAAGSRISGAIADEEAFLGARPCVATEAAGRNEDCLRTIRATVLSAQNARSGKASVFQVRLRAPVPAPADQPFNLDSNGDLAYLIEPGEEVEVTTWRDNQVSVSQDGVAETLPGLPDEATMYVGLTLVVVWATALAFITAFGSARRARCHATGRSVTPRVGFGGAKALGMVIVPLAASFLSLTLWDAWTAAAMTVVIWALIAVPATYAALRWDRDE